MYYEEEGRLEADLIAREVETHFTRQNITSNRQHQETLTMDLIMIKIIVMTMIVERAKKSSSTCLTAFYPSAIFLTFYILFRAIHITFSGDRILRLSLIIV